MPPSPSTPVTLFVGNLSGSATEDQLGNLFSAGGRRVRRVAVVVDRYTGRPKGFGFVVMDSAEDAASAIRSLNGRTFLGRVLRVGIDQAKAAPPVVPTNPAPTAPAQKAPQWRPSPEPNRPNPRPEASTPILPVVVVPEPRPEKVDDLRVDLDELVAVHRASGDTLMVGEVLAQTIPEVPTGQLSEIFARVIAAWASPVQVAADPRSTAMLVEQLAEFEIENLVPAAVATALRFRDAGRPCPAESGDVFFRISESLCGAFDLDDKRPRAEQVTAAMTRLSAARSELQAAVNAFCRSTTVTAKLASIEVLKRIKAYSRYAIPADRVLLRDTETLLGPAFRNFCEACEQGDGPSVVRLGRELTTTLQRYTGSTNYSRQAGSVVSMVALANRHIGSLIEEGQTSNELATAPVLAVADGLLMADLTRSGRSCAVAVRLTNAGHGRAEGITATFQSSEAVELELSDPVGPFDVGGHSDRLVTLQLTPRTAHEQASVTVDWRCTTGSGAVRSFTDVLRFVQQRTQPDWDSLLRDPPYTIQPVRRKERLYGRSAKLRELRLHIASATSLFLWGQKRVGKTSILQVLVTSLLDDQNVACVLLRMGEIVGLHEGQIAHRIAVRLVEETGAQVETPSEEWFGAGMGRLIPFVERLSYRRPEVRMLVVIDEFDDLPTAFYTGERGRQFIKSLRSLSESGITFFFVGSERMDAIYRAHESDLNKWVNSSLDCISSPDDCKALVQAPVKGAIDFQDAAIRQVSECCLGNPFYMQLLCYRLFERCVEEGRTYVGETDVSLARHHLLQALGPAMFSHFWEDNPALVPADKDRQAAENCLLLTAIATASSESVSVDDIVAAQERFGLPHGQRMEPAGIRRGLERLQSRRVVKSAPGTTFAVLLPIFSDWLRLHGELQVLKCWREYCQRRSEEAASTVPLPSTAVEPISFPIPEDDLLAVSQRLTYCGRQKDVAEVRQWLRQFDDDSRIEVAFQLLRRLADRGYCSEGARSRELTKLCELVQAKRRSVGDGVWKAFKHKHDNLCITYVDSETKSGATTAREIAKQLRAVKCGAAGEIGQWVTSRIDSDPLLLVVDDFAGSGTTITKGLHKARVTLAGPSFDRLLSEGRVACYMLFAFPDALTAISTAHPGIEVMASTVLGDDVRALDPDAGIFDTEDERRYAQEFLLQLGRELTPQNPLGWGDIGALIAFHNTVPNNTLPIFWSNGTVGGRPWKPLFPRA